MREIGLDISGDYPKGLTAALVEWADVIVPVEEHYGDEIVDRFQEAPLG
jgi:protein-tyrosine-phosphatase